MTRVPLSSMGIEADGQLFGSRQKHGKVDSICRGNSGLSVNRFDKSLRAYYFNWLNSCQLVRACSHPGRAAAAAGRAGLRFVF